MLALNAPSDYKQSKFMRFGRVENTVRRRWERLPIAIPVFVRGSDETGRKFVEFATAANINAGGMLLVTKHPMPAGLVVTLEIPTPTPFFQAPSHTTHGALSATVLYENYSEGFHLCGMAFTEPLLDESKI